jgi:hypothetical protein
VKVYRCQDHGFELRLSTGPDGREKRHLIAPTPVMAAGSNQGIPPDCALPVCPTADLQAGGMHRRDPGGGLLSGTCRIVEVE